MNDILRGDLKMTKIESKEQTITRAIKEAPKVIDLVLKNVNNFHVSEVKLKTAEITRDFLLDNLKEFTDLLWYIKSGNVAVESFVNEYETRVLKIMAEYGYWNKMWTSFLQREEVKKELEKNLINNVKNIVEYVCSELINKEEI